MLKSLLLLCLVVALGIALAPRIVPVLSWVLAFLILWMAGDLLRSLLRKYRAGPRRVGVSRLLRRPGARSRGNRARDPLRCRADPGARRGSRGRRRPGPLNLLREHAHLERR